MDKWNAAMWQLLWFFSMRADEQRNLIGRTEKQWFIEETATNVGANYLQGLCIAYDEISLNCSDDSHYALNIRETIQCLLSNLDPNYWDFEKLSNTQNWKSIREIAIQYTSDAKPFVCPPSKPFLIEDLIHVEHYAHANEIRKHISN